jgi:hypothetical protein
MKIQMKCKVNGCGGIHEAQGFCARHYRKAKYHGEISVIQPKHSLLKERFDHKSKANSETDCIEWVGTKNKGGYGLTKINGKTTHVHRAAYELVCGAIPDGLHVLHKCDNRSCINPSHLFLGTNQDNMDDRNTKGRQACLKGELNGCAKLTEGQVRDIRSDNRLHREIAADYGVVKSTVSAIKRAALWRHVA